MPDDKVMYSVTTPDGRTEQWDQKTYDELSDKLYGKYPNAKVARVSSYVPEEDDGSDQDQFQVMTADGRTESWTRKDFNELYKPLMEKYPDAQVYRVSDMSDRYWRPKMQEAKAAADAFDTQHGEAMRQYEAKLKEAGTQVARNANLSDAQKYVVEHRDEYESLKRQSDSLNAAYYNNPIIRQGRQAAYDNAMTLRDEYLTNAEKAASGQERRDWKRAAKLQEDAAELYSAPSQYKEGKNGFAEYLNDYWAGAKNTFSDRDFWTRGITQIARDLDLYGIRQKVQDAEKAKGGDLEEGDYDRILTPSEKAQLFAAYSLAYAQADEEIGRSKDLASAYRAGSSAAESLGFMAEFLLGTGVSNIAGKAILKGSTGSMARWLGEAMMSEGAVNDAVKKGVIKGVERSTLQKMGRSAAQSLVKGASHTAFQPLGTLSSITQKMNETDSEGELNTIWEGVGLGLADTLIENWSESVGQTFDIGFGAVGDRLGKVGRRTFKTDFGKMAKWALNSDFGKVLTEAGFNGFLGEMMEEWAGNAVRLATPLMDKEGFEQFASIQQQLEMAASFAPMTLVGLAGNAGSAMAHAKRFDEMSGTVKDILMRNGVTQPEIDEIFNKKYATSEDISAALAPYAQKVLQNEGTAASEDYRAILGFAQEFGAKSFLDAAKEMEDENDRSMMRDAITFSTGQFWTEGEGGERVRVIERRDGTREYVISESGEEGPKMFATVREDGTHGFINEIELREGQDDGTLTYRDMEMTPFLQERVDAAKSSEEAARMNEEMRQRLAEVRRRVMHEGVINMGTPEAPRVATVIPESATPAGVSVIVDDGNGGQQQAQLSWEEAGSYLGTPIVAQTDEQIAEAEAEEIRKADARKDKYNKIPIGTNLNVEMGDGSIVPYRFAKAIHQENEEYVRIYVADESGQLATDENGDEIWFPDMMIPGIDALAETESANAAAVGEGQVKEDAQMPEAERAVARYTDESGKVNQTVFMREEPEEWARWNDERRGDGGLSSVQRLNAAVSNLDKEIGQINKELEAEANPDVADEKEAQMNDLLSRRTRLSSILDMYAQQMAENAAAEERAAQDETDQESAEGATASNAQEQPVTREQVMADMSGRFQQLRQQMLRSTSAEELQKVMEAKAEALRQMYAALGITDVTVTTRAQVLGQMAKDGRSKKAIADVRQGLADSEERKGLRGFIADGAHIYALADGIRTPEIAIIMYRHESKHVENRKTGAPAAALTTGVTRNEMVPALAKYTNSTFYSMKEDIVLADEIIAIAEEIAEIEGVDMIPQRLREMGITTEEFITFVKNNIENGRRNGEPVSSWVGGSVRHGGSEVGSGENDAAPGEGASEVGERPGSAARSAEAAEGGAEPAAGEPGEQPVVLNSVADSISEETAAEMREKGLVMDGGTVMGEDQAVLKEEAGYKTPNELDTAGDPIVGDVLYSYTTLDDWQRNYLSIPGAKQAVVTAVRNMAERMAANELVYGVTPKGVYKYGEKHSGSKAGPLRTNQEYIVTFDIDTSCPRSLQYLAFVKQIEAQIGRPLTMVESIQLIEMMRAYGLMIPCVYCYCENKRQALKQYYTDFMSARRGVINAKTEEEALAAMYGHETSAEAKASTDPKVALTEASYEVFQLWLGEKDYNPTMRQLWAQYRNDRNVVLTALDRMLDEGKLSTRQTDKVITNRVCALLGIEDKGAMGSVGDIVSEWKWDRIEDREHDDFTPMEEDDMVVDQRTLNLWREMTNYGKSASGAKNILRYVPYTDELKTLSQEEKDYINGMGGLRMHSSNDFRIDYVLDYFQFMADMAVGKMMGHTYTKSPEFVRIFGGSGYRINMSIAAYEDSHGIRPNADEGFDWETAKDLRSRFPNAGTMLMATSDAQIQYALDNDWVDMVIPFHHSGLPKAVWYDMRAWTDYTQKQGEKFLNAGEMRAELKADGVEIPKGAKAEQIEQLYNEHFNIRVLTASDGSRIKPHFLPGKTIVKGVEIPGHGNDYETYMRLCREYGVRPRFYGIKVKDNSPEGGGREIDITEHPRYMILIKETARTDTPQTPIQFNFDRPSEALDGKSPMQYAFDELEARAMAEAEMAGHPVSDIYESYKQDIYGIVPQFVDTIIKHKETTGEDYPLDYLTPDSRRWFMTERRALEEAYRDFDTIPYHSHEYDEDGNLVMEPEQTPERALTEAQQKALAFVNGETQEVEAETETESESESESTATDEEVLAEKTSFSVVEDPLTIAELEASPKIRVYRSMAFIPNEDGEVEVDLGDGRGVQKGFLYSPMATQVRDEKGRWSLRKPTHIGAWEQSDEHPEKAIQDEDGNWVYRLKKPNGDTVDAAYNPYIHTSRIPLNDQFTSAHKRPELVTVEVEVPETELTSGYKAEKAKDAVGEIDWHKGPVASQLPEGRKRSVILSRYDKPIRVVPNSEVADTIVSLFDGAEMPTMPWNVFTPALRAELRQRGVEFSDKPSGTVSQKDIDNYLKSKEEGATFSLRGEVGAANDPLAMADLAVAEDMEKAGKDSKEIWVATGWERGKDGKWRNEIPDGKQKTIISTRRKNVASDVIDAPDVFKAYPEIKDYPVVFKAMKDCVGKFVENEKTFYLHPKFTTDYDVTPENMDTIKKLVAAYVPTGRESRKDIDKYIEQLLKYYGKLTLSKGGVRTMMHEMQHAIQRLEGFAKGGNKNMMMAMYLDDVAKTRPELVTFALGWSSTYPARKMIVAGRAMLAKTVDVTAQRNEAAGASTEYVQRLRDLADYLANMPDSKYMGFVRQAKALWDTALVQGKEGYLNLAGEVESRNVERRMSLDEGQKRVTPPSATEDVDRADQIVRFSVSEEQDKEYLDAVEAGDMEKAQRMVLEAAKAAMPDTKVVDGDGNPLVMYHGTRFGGFNSFDIGNENYPRGAYFTRNEKAATGYANYDDGEYYDPETERRVYKVFLDIENPLIADKEGGIKVGDKNYHIREINDMEGAAKAIVSAGYDGVIMESGSDEMTVVFNPSKIKSAEPVTYDDSGKVIPLSQRFNQENDDVRFSVAYHGSSADFDEFEDGHYREGTGSFHRPGLYFASDEKSSKAYAYDKGNGAFLYEVELPDDDGTNYIHMHESMPKPKRRELAEKIRQTFPEKDFDAEKKIVNQPIVADPLLNNFTNEELEKLGFVGVVGPMYIATMPQKQYIIFNPKDVKMTSKTNVSTGDEIRFSVANENQEMFVSNAEKAVKAIPQEKATPEQWLKMLEKNGGLKAGEDKWLGLSQWLKDSDAKTLTKQEIEAYIAENKINIEETQYAENVEKDYAEAIKSYQDEYAELVEEGRKTLPPYENAYDYALDKMIDRYGDDFEMAFMQDGDSISPTEDWDRGDDLSEAALHFLDQRRKGSTERIDSVRLGYTTEGLDGKREIALTVPTIEPWNTGDKIHFGDAGEGRAIAWVRFGDAQMSADDFEEKRAAYEEAAKKLDETRNNLINKYALEATGSKRYFELATPEERSELDAVKAEERAKFDEYTKARYNYKKVLFIDEIQSKRHQEGREKGYKEGDELQENQELTKKYWELDGEYTRLQLFEEARLLRQISESEEAKKLIGDDGLVINGKQDEYNALLEKNDEYVKIREQMSDISRERDEVMRQIQDNAKQMSEGVPPAPFEKNWHELAMKRMLRLAAEEGYDYVAWTTGEQQAERYNLGKSIEYIQVNGADGKEKGAKIVNIVPEGREDSLYLTVNTEGEVIEQFGSSEWPDVPTLTDAVGKELAVKILGSENGTIIQGDGLRIGGEGMKGFYDEMLPRFVDKYAKKWNTKTGDRQVTLSDGAMLDAHVLPVTQEMKDSVMEGQTMFSVVEDRRDQEVERQDMLRRVDEGGLPAAIGEEQTRDLYRGIYTAIPEDIMQPMVDKALRSDMNVQGRVRQYLHKLAEGGTQNDKTGLLFAICDNMRYITGNNSLTDEDIRYMLWKDTADAKDGDILSLAESRAMRNRWGVGSPVLFSAQGEFEQATSGAWEGADQKVIAANYQLKKGKEEAKKEESKAVAIIKAMRAQKTYDKATVDSIVRFAKEILKNGKVSDLTMREVSRLLTLVNNSTGKSPRFTYHYADQLMDLLLDHIVGEEEAKMMKLVNTKASTVAQSGVEKQGKLDVLGQITMRAFRENMSSSAEEIQRRIEDLSDRINHKDKSVRDDAFAEWRGLVLAAHYAEDIVGNVEEEKDLRKELEEMEKSKKEGQISKEAYGQYAKSAREALMQNKLERIDAFRTFSERLADVISGSAEKAAEFREADKQRIEDIHHDANRDMQGVDAKEHLTDGRLQRFLNSDIVRFFFKSLGTFDQMLRLLGRKNVRGEGYLWNRYMRQWEESAERKYRGIFEAEEELDKQVSLVFGKDMKWSDLYAVEREMKRKEGKHTVTFLDGGELREHELTQGNLLYIYMADKMVDGRMKLRAMGIIEKDVEAIKGVLDPRFIKLADWLQNTYLVNLRNKYNAVHERMFGAPMAAIENYFPLKILSNARFEEVDLGNKTDGNQLSSTTTGSVIKRRKNSLPLDIMHTDAFSLVIEHVEQMEDWAAFAEYRRDLNTLLSYKHFRNQVQNMNTIYGSGKTLWRNFMDVASISAGNYRPKVGKGDLDTIALNAAKGVTAAKIAFRVNTAIKQLLSFPAYLPDANIGYLAKSLATPGASWKWCMENLPVFEQRWKSRIAGDTRLLDTESDWKIWRDNLVKTASRLGMTPNAFVDATTVAVGAKAMYDTKKAGYLRDGYDEEEADRKAKEDATILYNQTQQSSEGAFVSTVQLDRTWLSVMLSTYRNSSMSYQRQLHDSLRTLGRMMKPGYRRQAIDFMTHQRENEGLDEDIARRGAEREYNRQWVRNAARVAVFGYGLQLLWKIGNNMWYLLFGDDDDEKEKILQEAVLSELAAPVEGLVGGNVISDRWGQRMTKKVEGEYGIKKNDFGSSNDLATLPIVSDMKTILGEWRRGDKATALSDIVDILAQAGVGVNPRTFSDVVAAVVDACNGDLDTAKEAAILVMRIAQIPQSTIDKFWIDEIDMSAADARELTTEQLAQRYAHYKLMKNNPYFAWMYSDAEREKKIKKYEDQFKGKVKERMLVHGFEKAPETVGEAYKRIVKEAKAFQHDYNVATKAGDSLTVQEMQKDPMYQEYVIYKKHQKALNALEKKIKVTKDDSLRETWQRDLDDEIRAMINELSEIEQ